VGRQTVLRALNDLAREGLIVRRRGSGSYVIDGTQPPIMPGRNLHFGVLWPEDVGPGYMHNRSFGGMTLGALSTWGMDHATPKWDMPGPNQFTSGTYDLINRGLKVTLIGQSTRARTYHPPIEAVQSANLDGLLSFSIIEDAWLKQVLDLGIPVVLGDYASDKFRLRVDQVYHDPLPGYREAVHYFVSKGLKRIHFLGCYLSVPAPNEFMDAQGWIAFKEGKRRLDPDSALRLSAYRQAMDECGLAVEDGWVHHEFHNPDRCIALGQRLADGPADDQPEAIICHGVNQAEWVIQGFRAHGGHLVGAGATSERHEGAALTVRADLREMGSAAAELLISRLQRPKRSVFRVGIPMFFDADGLGKRSTETAGRAAEVPA
jgi:DNA-binding LacI/PurR family transcriptional regulator